MKAKLPGFLGLYYSVMKFIFIWEETLFRKAMICKLTQLTRTK